MKEKASDFIINIMLSNAELAFRNGKLEQAFSLYKKIAETSQNADAQYNLAVLYAQGKGTNQDFLKAAYWFNQAHINGDAEAEKLRLKCMLDYVHMNFEQKTPLTLFAEMEEYAKLLFPEKDSRTFAAENLSAMGGNHFNKKEYKEAAKLFRAAAEYGNHAMAQNYLAVLYNIGKGVEGDDRVSLYWFDRAADNGVEVAKRDRDGILNAYRESRSEKEFSDVMRGLSEMCDEGIGGVPKDYAKARYWMEKANI